MKQKILLFAVLFLTLIFVGVKCAKDQKTDQKSNDEIFNWKGDANESPGTVDSKDTQNKDDLKSAKDESERDAEEVKTDTKDALKDLDTKDTSQNNIDISVPNDWQNVVFKGFSFRLPPNIIMYTAADDENYTILNLNTSECAVPEKCMYNLRLEIFANPENKPIAEFTSEFGAGTANLYQDAAAGYEEIDVNDKQAVKFMDVVGETTNKFVVVIPFQGKLLKISKEISTEVDDDSFWKIIYNISEME